MKAAVIGASSEALHTIKAAQKLGVFVVALDGNPKAEGLKAADKALCVDISDENATIEALQKEKPDFVLTVPIGRYLTTIGAVNDALHLKGITKETAVLCTDKYAFHQAMQEKNLRDCHCFLVEAGNTSENTDRFAGLTYPAVLKPRFGSGSRAIYFVNSQEELSQDLREIQNEQEDFVLEEAVSGKEYGVDGAVINGSFQLILLREKINTPLPRRQAVGYFSIDPLCEKELYESVKQYLEKTVSVLMLNDCLFHADLILHENTVFAIELSARPSGHYLHNLFTPLATGVDEAKEYIHYVCEEPFLFKPVTTQSLLIHFFDLPEGIVEKIYTKEALILPKDTALIDYRCNILEGDRLEEVTGGHSIMGRGYFIIKGKDKDTMLKAAEAVKDMFQIVSV